MYTIWEQLVYNFQYLNMTIIAHIQLTSQHNDGIYVEPLNVGLSEMQRRLSFLGPDMHCQ